MQLEFTRTGPYEYSCTVHGPTDPYVAQYNTVQLYSRRKLAGIQRSLGNPRISRNRRNLQNRNSAAAEIAIRFGPKILLKWVELDVLLAKSELVLEHRTRSIRCRLRGDSVVAMEAPP
eukprot:COSAG02_NODE_10579_length_1908_cov_5.801548_1_plen_117_part_10